MYNASELRTKGKAIFDLALTQPVIIERRGKRYLLTAYDVSKTLGGHEQRLRALEAKLSGVQATSSDDIDQTKRW